MFSIHVSADFSRLDDAADPLAWSPTGRGYRVILDGDRAGDVILPWPRLIGLMDALEGPGALAAIGELGAALHAALGEAGWERADERLLQAQAQGRRAVVQISSHAAEIPALPWELLPLGGSGPRLGQSPALLRYAWPGTRTVPRREGGPAGRVLFAWSAAGGPVPVAEHLAALQQAGGQGARAFDDADTLPQVTLRGLAERLDQPDRPVAALHLLCHGAALGGAPGTFGLSLDSSRPGGPASLVDGEALAALLAPHAGTLRLVVLCACKGAGQGLGADRVGSVALALHRAGIQAVVASRSMLSAEGSAHLARAFYRELLGRGASVEAAFVAGRAALNINPASRDWIHLQLFARAADGDETDLWPEPPGERTTLASEALEGALDALEAQRAGEQAPPAPTEKTQGRSWKSSLIRALAGAVVSLGTAWIATQGPTAPPPPVEPERSISPVAPGAADPTQPVDPVDTGPKPKPTPTPPPAPTPPAEPAHPILPGKLTVRLEHGLSARSTIQVTQEGAERGFEQDTALSNCLAPGTYQVSATRVPGEPPVTHEVQVRSEQATPLCLDLATGALCANTDTRSAPFREGEQCP